MLASIRQRPILIIILGLIAGLCLCCVIIFIIFPVDFFDRLTESLELETPIPTIAPERTLEAMFFAGTGNEDVDVDKGSEPAVAHFTYSG